MVGFLIGLLNVVVVLVSVFLVCVVLIQRGKGGGLAGAFGGVGGSSAFGTKAGDVFTRITIGVAIGWMLALMLLVVLSNSQTGSDRALFDDDASAPRTESRSSKSKATADGKASGGTAAPEGSVPAPSPSAAGGLETPPMPPPLDASSIPAPTSTKPSSSPASGKSTP